MTDKTGLDDQIFTDKYTIKGLPGFNQVPRDMQDALDKFNGEAEEIVRSLLQTLDSQEPPPIIYHYTNDLGLRGILETGQLWLTDIFNLNDPSELHHGFSHAIEILRSRAVTGPPECRTFAERFAAFALKGGIRGSAHFFICSFSSCRDDLGQWRAYGDNGRGYVLGFDGKALENGFTKEGEVPIPNNCTFHVMYKDAEVRAIHGQLIEKMLDLISLPRGRHLESAAINAYMGELQLCLTMHALRIALFFKHAAYENEKEYRFMQIHRADVPPPEVKVRARPYSLVGYREFNWRKVAADSLKQIVVGPAADYEKASQFARDCLRLFQAGTIDITRSEIPYRAA